MKPEDAIKLFGLNNLAIEADVQRIENELDVDLGHKAKRIRQTDEAYYPQFSEALRNEAESMADHYAIFYCLENFIRKVIVERMKEVHGVTWWDTAVPEAVRKKRGKQSEERIIDSNYTSLQRINRLHELRRARRNCESQLVRFLRYVPRHSGGRAGLKQLEYLASADRSLQSPRR